MNTQNRIQLSFNLLRYFYGAVILLAGLDKVFTTNLIVLWPKYVSPFVTNMLPISMTIFLVIIGIIEVIVSILLLTKWPRLGGYISALWLVLISVNLLMLGYIDIAIRDILLAVGAVVLSQLSVVVEETNN